MMIPVRFEKKRKVHVTKQMRSSRKLKNHEDRPEARKRLARIPRKSKEHRPVQDFPEKAEN